MARKGQQNGGCWKKNCKKGRRKARQRGSGIFSSLLAGAKMVGRQVASRAVKSAARQLPGAALRGFNKKAMTGLLKGVAKEAGHQAVKSTYQVIHKKGRRRGRAQRHSRRR